MYGLQIWPVDALFNSRNGRNEQVFCPILSGGGGGSTFWGGVGGGKKKGVNFGHAKSAVKKNSFVYVSM